MCGLQSVPTPSSRAGWRCAIQGVLFAWVLWQNSSSLGQPQAGKWELKEAFESKTECDAALQRAVYNLHETVRSLGKDDPVYGLMYNTDGVWVRYRLVTGNHVETIS